MAGNRQWILTIPVEIAEDYDARDLVRDFESFIAHLSEGTDPALTDSGIVRIESETWKGNR